MSTPEDSQVPTMAWRVVGGKVSEWSHLDRLTDRSQRILELSLREALQLGHNYIGTEHLLLAIIREGHCVAARALERGGLTLSEARRAVITEITVNGRDDDPDMHPLQPRVNKLARELKELQDEISKDTK